MSVAFDASSGNTLVTNTTSFTDNTLTIGNELNRVLVYSLNFWA